MKRLLALTLASCVLALWQPSEAIAQSQRRSTTTQTTEAARLRAESIDKWLRRNGYTPSFTREDDRYLIRFKSQGYDLIAVVGRDSDQCRVMHYADLDTDDISYYVALWTNNKLMNEYFSVVISITGDDFDSICFDVPFWEDRSQVPGDTIEAAIGIIMQVRQKWGGYYKELREALGKEKVKEQKTSHQEI